MDLMSIPPASLIILILIAVVSFCFFFSSKSPANLPPGPFNLPVLGCLHKLGSLPHISLHNLSRKYGGVMYLKLGSIPTVIISTEKAAKEIFKNYSLEFASKAPLISSKYFGNDFSGLVFSQYTPEVKLYRKLVNSHLLSPTRLKVHDGIRREEQLRFARSIRDESGKPVLLRQKFHEMNLNVISYMLFGKRFCGFANSTDDSIHGFVEAVVEAVRIAGVFNLSDYIPGIRWFDVQGLEKQYKKIMKRVNGHLYSILQERREKPPVFTEEHPMAFIDVLISMDSTGEELPDITKISLLLDMLLGAVDTSALSTEWAMAELLRHPDELKKAQCEADEVVGSKQRLINESDIEKLPYIDAIAKETLRLRSVAPLAIPKLVKGGPIHVSGYTIPEGTMIYISSYSIGIEANFWRCPLEFQPQRFIDADVDVFGQSFHFLPFGTGRRVCPGAKLGFDALKTGIATLVHGFDWELDLDLRDPKELNMDQTFGLVCKKSQPLVAVPRSRLDTYVY